MNASDKAGRKSQATQAWVDAAFPRPDSERRVQGNTAPSLFLLPQEKNARLTLAVNREVQLFAKSQRIGYVPDQRCLGAPTEHCDTPAHFQNALKFPKGIANG